MIALGLDALADDGPDLPAPVPARRRPVEVEESVRSLALGVLGAAAGSVIFWKAHPVLGALGGFTAGRCALPIASGRGRGRAIWKVGEQAAAIGCALAVPKLSGPAYIAARIAGMGIERAAGRIFK